MKKLLLAVLATLSLNAFAQSYLIMDNGMVVTTDRSGFAYDMGNFAFPQKVTMKGGQFFVEDNSVIVTIDENGTLFRKYEVIPEKILGKGINYFISEAGELYTIDAQGLVHITTNEAYKLAGGFGGNYFMTSAGELYTVNREGIAQKIEIEGLVNLRDVVAFGGRYFMTNRGVVYTIADDGRLTPRADVRVGVLQKRGGNFFTDSANIIYTVSTDGDLIVPALPMGFKLMNMTKTGTNYFLDLNGKLFAITNHGEVYERVVDGLDMRNVRIISL
jgi:hypothetical protein